MQAGDRAYFYKQENTTILRHPGEVIGALLNCESSCDLDIANGLKQSVYMMTAEDMDTDKYVFFFIDRCPRDLRRQVNKGLSLDIKEDVGCKFVLCSIGSDVVFEVLDDLCEAHPRCTHLHFSSTNNIGSSLIDLCVNTDPPNYSPLDISELKKEYDGETSLEA